MSWLAVSFTIDSARIERMTDALIEAGAISADVADAHAGTGAERPIFDEPGEMRSVWAESRVTALFDRESDVEGALGRAFAAAGVDRPGDVVTDVVDEQDWVRLTQAQFGPIRITDRLWIVPTWCEPPAADAISIRLDPGLAFGTGSHPTTALCLGWLEREVRGGETVLDYGCGSGILVVAALRLGAASATGVDIDAQAVEAARANALRNGVDARFALATASVPEPAEIVVANILANPLVVLAPLLAAATRPGGRIALSGILAEQAQEVLDAYAGAFDIALVDSREGWTLLAGRRRQVE